MRKRNLRSAKVPDFLLKNNHFITDAPYGLNDLAIRRMPFTSRAMPMLVVGGLSLNLCGSRAHPRRRSAPTRLWK
jgi:hypothetical protein